MTSLRLSSLTAYLSLPAGLLAGLLAWAAPAAGMLPASGERRATLAVTWAEGRSTQVDLTGTAARPGPLGRAEVERKPGRTRVKVRLEPLPHPQSFGSFYTTYVLWAVAPEGRSASLAELPHGRKLSLDVTTPWQTFGLIVCAEPYGAVPLPSPLIVAETALRQDTTGQLHTAQLEYGGALYGPAATAAVPPDYVTPLPILAARRALTVAGEAGAASYAGEELERARVRLSALEHAWPRSRSLPKGLESEAREVVRAAEHARAQARQAREQAGLDAERRSASLQVAQAQGQADRARQDAEQARAQAESEQKTASAARDEAERARVAEELARAGRAQAEARADLERQAAEGARQEAQSARHDQEQLRQQLYQSLSAILETRREARGLVVNLSDVLFDFDRASVKPAAREKLAKLAGVLLAYPGRFHLEFEGHTDAVGSPEYNLRLSVARAESVRFYLIEAGLPPDAVGGAVGYGPDRPVAGNDSTTGRQLNRRVEIVISDLA